LAHVQPLVADLVPAVNSTAWRYRGKLGLMSAVCEMEKDVARHSHLLESSWQMGIVGTHDRSLWGLGAGPANLGHSQGMADQAYTHVVQHLCSTICHWLGNSIRPGGHPVGTDRDSLGVCTDDGLPVFASTKACPTGFLLQLLLTSWLLSTTSVLKSLANVSKGQVLIEFEPATGAAVRGSTRNRVT
jgi:hypothetical protein